jgi:hypothetical protein
MMAEIEQKKAHNIYTENQYSAKYLNRFKEGQGI